MQHSRGCVLWWTLDFSAGFSFLSNFCLEGVWSVRLLWAWGLKSSFVWRNVTEQNVFCIKSSHTCRLHLFACRKQLAKKIFWTFCYITFIQRNSSAKHENPHVISNLCDFLSSVEHKGKNLAGNWMVTFLKAQKKDIKHHKVTHLLYSKPPQVRNRLLLSAIELLFTENLLYHSNLIHICVFSNIRHQDVLHRVWSQWCHMLS